MTKLLTFFNETFSDGLSYVNDIWQIAKEDKSINGFYVALPDFLEEGFLGRYNPSSTITWYNALGDGNYLYGGGLLRINSSGQFNNKPCIQFNDNGLTSLRYRYPVNVGTLVMVYLTRLSGSYIVYAPRQTPSPNSVYYDAFVPGSNTLWANELLTGSSIYNARSRINSKDVSPTIFIPLNNARVLSVTDIANSEQRESISGYGGQYGVFGGGSLQGGVNSLRGSLAAVITYENPIAESLLEDLELILGQYYIKYEGIQQTSQPSFKHLVNSNFNYDFSNIFVDEWFDITSYELVSPSNMGLEFDGSVLQGTLPALYENTIDIVVTNAAGMPKESSFELVVCREDPLISQLPALSNLTVALSANKHFDGGYYGLYMDSLNQVTAWEDARRVHVSKPIYKYLAVNGKPSQHVITDSLVNNQGTVKFSNNSVFNGSGVSAKTFIWVYYQDSYGIRNMLNTFPDIKGTGVLWTVTSNSEVHGGTDITKLLTKVQKISVNTLNFKIPLQTPYIITATSADNNSITFSGLNNMRGGLAFFACWDTVLLESELNTAVSLLAERYYSDLSPYIFDTSTEFRTQTAITVDLNRKVVDLKNLQLTFDLLTPIYDASISPSGILTVTAVQDEVLDFSINVTNTDNLTSTLTFQVDAAVRPNPLYLNLKSILGTAFVNIFLPELDTLVLDGLAVTEWRDYRLNGYSTIGSNLTYTNLEQLNGYASLDFNLSGSSYLTVSPAITGRCFIMVYVRKEGASGRCFLFGQATAAEFSSGLEGRLWDNTTSYKITNEITYVNGKPVLDDYVINPQTLTTVYINTTEPVTIDSIAKDRLFTDRSVKGYISAWFILDRLVTPEEVTVCDKHIRDYFDPARFITLLHLDANVSDSSIENKFISSNASIVTTNKQFGAGSAQLCVNSVAKYIDIPNDTDYAFLNESFTISFWLNINKHLDTNDVFSLHSQTDLVIYLKGNKLYIGRNYVTDIALINYTVPTNMFNTFSHIALTRLNSSLSLYIKGVLIATVTDTKEYRDYNTLVRLGQRTNPALTTNLLIYMDEYAVYKRGVLHAGEAFTPPSSPYTV